MSSLSLSNLVAGGEDYAQALFDLAASYGAKPRITSVVRTFEEQSYYYNLRLKGQWPYPVAKPGTSAHEFGYAFDMAVTRKVDQQALLAVWRSWGGITFDYDPVHFQFPNFTPPDPSGTAPVGPGTRTYRPFDQLADLFLYFIPGLGTIIGKAQLAASIYQILSGSTSDATWYIQHPIEALRDFQDWVISLLPAVLQGPARVAVAPFGSA